MKLFAALLVGLMTFVLLPREARADKVAVLPFVSAGGATSVSLDQTRSATRDAAIQLKHVLPTDSQMLTAEMSIKGGSNTTEMYRSAGRAASADWTVLGRVAVHGNTDRVELEVCQVDSGRTESLAREIDPSTATAQIAEMLALLLRPEGIGNADIPWDHAPTVTPPLTPPPPAGDKNTPPPPVDTTPAPPPGPPPVAHVYAEGHPFAAGISTGLLTALHRPSATGSATLPSSTSWLAGASFGYALDAVRGLELRANMSGSLVGPGSFSADAGARYALPVIPTMRIFAGPELGLGTFVALGGEKIARFLMRGALVGAVGIGERVQLELGANFDYAPGGSAALLLFGGTARGLVRF